MERGAIGRGDRREALVDGMVASDRVVRAPGGWRIERLIQHVGWQEGNTAAVAEAAQRNGA